MAKQRAAPVSFPNWKEALATTSGSQATKDNVQQCVFAFLRFCKAKRAGASITVAQDFIGERERQAGNRDEALREALRWFLRPLRVREPASRPGEPEGREKQ